MYIHWCAVNNVAIRRQKNHAIKYADRIHNNINTVRGQLILKLLFVDY